MSRQNLSYRLEVITDTKSFAISEDCYFVAQTDTALLAMVADGAPQRLRTTGSMRPLLDRYGPQTAPGRFAALHTRDAFAEFSRLSAAGMQAAPALDRLILDANAALGADLARIYGDLSVDAILKHEPSLVELAEDPRFIRWVLPVCCVTAARVDLEHARLDFAHGGDTALFLLYRDGSTRQITPDQMGQHDDKVRARVRSLMDEHTINSRDDLAPFWPDIRALDRYNGIYHNYEDAAGQPDTRVGVGVVNGLPRLADYLVTGSLDLANVAAVLLGTDGIFWPSSLDETPDQQAERLNQMGRLIREEGLAAYIRALRAEEASDPGGALYQRFGLHDDATAVLLRLEA